MQIGFVPPQAQNRELGHPPLTRAWAFTCVPDHLSGGGDGSVLRSQPD